MTVGFYDGRYSIPALDGGRGIATQSLRRGDGWGGIVFAGMMDTKMTPEWWTVDICLTPYALRLTPYVYPIYLLNFNPESLFSFDSPGFNSDILIFSLTSFGLSA